MGQVPVDLATALAAKHGIARAVETGTWEGGSTMLLARIFTRVETVELSSRHAWKARRRFLFRGGIRVRHGSSADLLRPASRPTLYWLDAHWSGTGTAGEERECPLLDELRATSPGSPSDCYLIDDARLFLAPPPAPHKSEQWPSLDQIRDLVAEIRPAHGLRVEGDVIVVEPRRD